MYILAPSSCGSPDKLLNTTIEDTNHNIGSSIKYMCPIGYKLIGSETRKCEEDGFWSGKAPSCKCKVF